MFQILWGVVNISFRREKSVHQSCFQHWNLKCVNRQKRGLVYTKKLVFKGKKRKMHIHQSAFKVFVGDPFAQHWCIDFGLLSFARFDMGNPKWWRKIAWDESGWGPGEAGRGSGRGRARIGRGSGEAGWGLGVAGRRPGEDGRAQGCDRAREGRLCVCRGRKRKPGKVKFTSEGLVRYLRFGLPSRCVVGFWVHCLPYVLCCSSPCALPIVSLNGLLVSGEARCSAASFLTSSVLMFSMDVLFRMVQISH